jgi:vesicle-fusing ATPase
VSPLDFPDHEDIYLLLNGSFVLTARPNQECRPGEIGLTDAQRTWAGISLAPNEIVQAQIYSPFSQGGQSYLGGVDIEVGFAGRKTVETAYDQEQLAQLFTRVGGYPSKTAQLWLIISRPLKTRSSLLDRSF